jgi:hypothetical protein
LKLDSTKVASIILLVIFLLIIISIFTSGKKGKPETIPIGIREMMDNAGVSAESILGIGETLKIEGSERQQRVDIGSERPVADVAPRRVANANKEAIEKQRNRAIEMRNVDESKLDATSAAVLDSMRKIRAIQEERGTR